MKPILFISAAFTILFIGCKSFKAKPCDFPNKVHTTTRPINYQEKKTYAFPEQGIYADNQFDGARLNNIEWTEDGQLRVTIEPENAPINPSPYYAFKLWADSAQNVSLELTYPEFGFHRYWPKKSLDGYNWTFMDSTLVWVAADTSIARLELEIGPDTLWIAGQEVRNSSHVEAYCSRHN